MLWYWLCWCGGLVVSGPHPHTAPNTKLYQASSECRAGNILWVQLCLTAQTSSHLNSLDPHKENHFGGPCVSEGGTLGLEGAVVAVWWMHTASSVTGDCLVTTPQWSTLPSLPTSQPGHSTRPMHRARIAGPDKVKRPLAAPKLCSKVAHQIAWVALCPWGSRPWNLYGGLVLWVSARGERKASPVLMAAHVCLSQAMDTTANIDPEKQHLP